MKKSLLKVLQVLFAFGLGGLIIYLSLKNLTVSEKNSILESFKSAHYIWVVIAILIGILSHLIRAARWKLLLSPLNYNPSLLNTFYAVMVGYFANLGIPRAGEVFRCSVLYKQEQIPVNKSFGTVIVERSLDFIVFLGLFLLTLLIEFKKINQYVNDRVLSKLSNSANSQSIFSSKLFFLLIAAAFLFLAILLFRKQILKTKIGNKVFQFALGIWEGLKSIAKIEKPWLFIGYTILIWVCYFLMVYLCFYSLAATSDLGLFAGLSVMVLGSIGIMVTPGGIGLYPVIAAETLLLYGIESSTGVGLALGWISWSAQTIMILVFGSISLLIVSFKSK